MKEKDNPVPSLDKIIEEVYKEHYDMHRKGAYDFPEKEIWAKEQIKMFKLNNPELLQNGVETDKEEPKKCTCYLRSNQSHWCEKQKGKICKVTRKTVGS